MIVITLTKVPPSLRGDLTKWYQEIQTGVYVGNVSARIRDLLWEHIQRDIGSGQATMVYNAQNELGYQFKTTRKDHAVVDYDGLPLMKQLNEASVIAKPGFSDAAKYRRAKQVQRRNQAHKRVPVDNKFIVIDIETTGLNPVSDRILSIGAVCCQGRTSDKYFEELVLNDFPVPAMVTELTGITSELILSQGNPLEMVLTRLREFVGDNPILGYNVHFDEDFIQSGFVKAKQPELMNPFIDLKPKVKRAQKFLDNYRLETILDHYQIENSNPHHALSDAIATAALAVKLIENGDLKV